MSEPSNTTKVITVPAAEVQRGDMAHRRSGELDPRPVEEVTPGYPQLIRLRIGTLVTDPIPARWYRFTRVVSR